MTLNCNSDSNPPALNFSWFKENQSSAVGSGQSFIISSFNSSHSGHYYCEAQNQYEYQRSASVSVKGIHYKQTLLCSSCLNVLRVKSIHSLTISIIHMFKDFNKINIIVIAFPFRYLDYHVYHWFVCHYCPHSWIWDLVSHHHHHHPHHCAQKVSEVDKS